MSRFLSLYLSLSRISNIMFAQSNANILYWTSMCLFSEQPKSQETANEQKKWIQKKITQISLIYYLLAVCSAYSSVNPLQSLLHHSIMPFLFSILRIVTGEKKFSVYTLWLGSQTFDSQTHIHVRFRRGVSIFHIFSPFSIWPSICWPTNYLYTVYICKTQSKKTITYMGPQHRIFVLCSKPYI